MARPDENRGDWATDAHICAEKVRLLFANQASSFWLSLVTAIVPFGLAWQMDKPWLGLIWYAAFAAVAVGRFAVTRRYLASDPPSEHSRFWARRYMFGAGAAGSVWGVGALALAMTGDPTVHVLALFLAYGVVAAAVPLLGMHKPSMLAFQLPLIVPVTVWALFFRHEIDILLAYILALYIVGIRISQRQLEGYVDRSYRLKLENQKLIDRLNNSNHQLQAANLELTQLSGEDALTGLSNRRRYQERLALEWRRAARDGSQVSMVVVDIDYFKPYNDTLGHEAGDKCLRKVADLLERAANRPGDLVARYGGEEFVVLLPLTDRRGATLLAQRIQSLFAETAIPHPASPLGKVITVSIGVSSLRADRHKPNDLFHMADQALYRAKADGRNRIQFFRPEDVDQGAASA